MFRRLLYLQQPSFFGKALTNVLRCGKMNNVVNMQMYRSGRNENDSKDCTELVVSSASNPVTAGFSPGTNPFFFLLSCIEFSHFSKCLASSA